MSLISLTNFTGGEISPILSGRADLEIYSSSCARMENFIPLVHGPAMRRSGFRFVTDCKKADMDEPAQYCNKVRLIPYSYSADNSYIIELGHYYFRVLTENGPITDFFGNIVSVDTPYPDNELFQISFAQAGTNLYLAHKNHEPMIISVKNKNWTCEKLSYGSKGILPKMQTPHVVVPVQSDKAAPLVKSASYAVAVVDANGRITDMTSPTDVIKVPAKCDYENYVNINWTEFVLGSEFMVYQIVGETPSYIGRSTQAYYNEMGLLEPDYSKLPPKNIHKFTESGNHPSKVAFFDGRLIFAASSNEPNTIWGSIPGDYSYFAAKKVPTDSCAWKFSLDSGQVNKIMWLLPSSKLLVGTTGAEWRMSGANGSTITPNSVEARRETSWGSAEIRALSAGQETVFVDRSCKNIRTFRYANESAGYNSSNLSVYSEHLTRMSPIKDWDYARVPHSTIWTVTEDGQLLGLTYDGTQRVAAWHRHSTDGLFESVAVMSDKGRDLLFAVIRRNVNGQDVRYVEVMENDFSGNNGSKADTGFFVDCGLSYIGAPTKNINGLSHLRGKTVSICADGAVHPKRKVSETGTIALDFPANKVTVGLQYDSVLQTMPLECLLSDGSSASRIKRIYEIAVRLENTVGLVVGTDKTNLVRVPFRDSAIPMGSAPKLFSGDKKIAVKGGYESNLSVTVIQDQPMPMTVVAIFPRIRYGTK